MNVRGKSDSAERRAGKGRGAVRPASTAGGGASRGTAAKARQSQPMLAGAWQARTAHAGGRRQRTGNGQRRVVRCAAGVGAELRREGAARLQAGGAWLGSLSGRARSLGHGLEPLAEDSIVLHEPLRCERRFVQFPCQGSRSCLTRGQRVCMLRKRSAQAGVVPQHGGAAATTARIRTRRRGSFDAASMEPGCVGTPVSYD